MSLPISCPDPRDARVAEGGVRVLVAASVRLYRDGIALGLERTPGVGVVGVACDAGEVLAAVRSGAADVVLLDVSMGGALPLVQGICRAYRELRVVAFAVDDDHEDAVMACVEAGVAGWVGRDGSLDDLVRAVLSAARGELVCSARVAALLSRRVAALTHNGRGASPPVQLTPRESEIAMLITRGLSNKHIARTLSVQLATVKNHVHNILEKLNVNTRGEAGALLRETELQESGPRG
ncbi:MAG TPA: response regulator transcription factor [Longimicrobium sp.]|nr:response regulator transcription factor [Longimicrobium sp.]